MQEIYNSVKAKLLEIEQIKMVELWYGQFDDPEEAKLQKSLSAAVEFADIKPRQGNEGIVEGELTIRVRLAYRTLKEKDNDLEILTVRNLVNRHLNGHGLDGVFTGLQFTGELMDVKASHLLVWVMDFRTEYTDKSGYWYWYEVDAAPLQADVELPGDQILTIEP